MHNIDNPNHPHHLKPLSKGQILTPDDPDVKKAMGLVHSGHMTVQAAGERTRVENADGSVTDTTPISTTYYPNGQAKS